MFKSLKSSYSSQFWLLCLSTYLFFVSFNLIIPELPDYLVSLGGAEYKGLYIGLFTLAALISRPFSGKLADSIGRIPVIVIGTAVCLILGSAYPFVPTVFGFLLLRFLHGFSTGFQPTGTTSYLADTIPLNKRGEAMGYLGVAGSLGMASGPYLGGEIARLFNLNVMFFASSVAALISLLCLLGLKETFHEKQKFQWSHLAIWRESIVDISVMPSAIVMMLSSFCFGLILTIMPDYTKYLGIENKGMFFLVFTISSLFSRVFAGKISDRIGREPVIITALFLVILSLTILAFNHGETAFYLSGVLFGIGSGMNTPTIFAWTIDLGNPMKKAKSVATVFMGLEAGIFSGAMISAFIHANNPENFGRTFLSGAVAASIAFIYLLWYVRRKPTF